MNKMAASVLLVFELYIAFHFFDFLIELQRFSTPSQVLVSTSCSHWGAGRENKNRQSKHVTMHMYTVSFVGAVH